MIRHFSSNRNQISVEDVDLLFEVGYQVANGDKFPEWKPGIEFKAKRDAMMKK